MYQTKKGAVQRVPASAHLSVRSSEIRLILGVMLELEREVKANLLRVAVPARWRPNTAEAETTAPPLKRVGDAKVASVEASAGAQKEKEEDAGSLEPRAVKRIISPRSAKCSRA
jgi:hypothetical protein